MINQPFNLSWVVFFTALLLSFIPIMIMYTRAKSNTKDENDKLLNRIAFFANNFLLYLVSLIICMISLKPYYWYINSNHLNEFYKDLMGTGILLAFILWGLGAIIRLIYKGTLKLFNTDDVLNECDKETVLCISLLILICLFISVVDLKEEQVQKQFMFLFFILAVIIGKFIWLDTTCSKLAKQIKKIWKRNKSSIILGGLVLLIMISMWAMPIYVQLNTAVSFGIGLLTSMAILTIKAIYDYKKNI